MNQEKLPDDPKEVIRMFDLERIARDEGVKNCPPTEATQLDAPQQRVLTHYEDIIGGSRQGAYAKIGACKTELNELTDKINVPQVKFQLKDVASGLQPELAGLLQDLKDSLRRSREPFELANRRLRHFQHEHGLVARKPWWPDSLLLHYAWIAVIAIIEWSVLSVFYAEGSDYGLIGGVLYAAAFSIVNLGIVVWLGNTWRYLNHRSAVRKLGALVLCGALLSAFLALSLLAAHYRDATEKVARERDQAAAQRDSPRSQVPLNPSEGFQQQKDNRPATVIATYTLRYNPLGLDHAWSWVLFSAAIVFGAYAASTGYRRDDPYPGYGEVGREDRNQEEQYSTTKKTARESIMAFFNSKRHEAERIFEGLRSDIKSFDRAIEKAEGVVYEFDNNRNKQVSHCNTVLKKYRGDNRFVASAPRPKYFDDPAPISRELLAPLVPVDQRCLAQREKYSKSIEELAEILQIVAAEIDTKHTQALKDFDSQVELLEREVKEKLERELPLPT